MAFFSWILALLGTEMLSTWNMLFLTMTMTTMVIMRMLTPEPLWILETTIVTMTTTMMVTITNPLLYWMLNSDSLMDDDDDKDNDNGDNN